METSAPYFLLQSSGARQNFRAAIPAVPPYPPVMDMPSPDVHHLRAAAVGWLELGDATETLVELEKISASMFFL